MDKDKAKKANKDALDKQTRINQQWKRFATTYGKEAWDDYIAYADDQRAMFMKYAEEMQMPHPSGREMMPIDKDMIAILLQTSRGVNIMRSYITNRVKAA